MPTEPVARLRGVGRRYPGADSGAGALEGVDLDLRPGELVAFLGANGAGKTTLLRVLAGVLPPSAGTVQVLGFEDPAAAKGRTARQWRRLRGYIAQETALDPEMTGEEILRLFATLYAVPRALRQGRMARLVATFDLHRLLKRRVATFSGGQKRRLHLAAGLLHDPRLLLLDEPAAGLDLSGGDRLWDELEHRAQHGATVVVISHDLARVKSRAGRVIVLRAGEVVADGTPQEVLVDGGRAMEDLRFSSGQHSAPRNGGQGGSGRGGGGQGHRGQERQGQERQGQGRRGQGR